jgi:osmoprotectant transport system permease protein
MNGIRLAAVQVVATATIAALVAGGGLGNIILLGFGTQEQAAVVAGAVLVATFALAVELFFLGLGRRLDPVGRLRRTA